MKPPAPTSKDLVIAAAIRLFGRLGYDATSVRQITAEAGGQNAAMVNYYFGSKAGLRRACGEAILARVQTALPPVVKDVDAAQAARQLEILLSALLDFMTQVPEAEDMAAFILRELNDPDGVLDLLYQGMIEDRHRELCLLWGRATGTDPESERTRIAAFAMLGQILYFRIGRPVVVRRLGWSGIGPDEARKIRDVLTANLRASLAAHEGADT
ncbi:CerR family C-terminal domain-containing protein [Psychromarinibacter sp. S121]|uniref:CerR family C-terminal domain-containing protein n=1 Tax=Psychromarinibacter sp. S121 TaxID=3415127 RepID=UPI003C7AA5B4